MAKTRDERTKTELVRGVPVERTDLEAANEPPVVARLVIEIRSDGSRTVARGALEDAQRGERVTIEARADSPLQLAIALARALTQVPRLSARSAVRGLLAKKKDK